MIYQTLSLEASPSSPRVTCQDVSAGRLWYSDGSLKPEAVFATWSKGTPFAHYLTRSTFVFFIQSVSTLYTTSDYCKSRTHVVVSKWF